METTCTELSQATGYVLGTLPRGERERYDRHLRSCPECSLEVELLRGAIVAPGVMATPTPVALAGERATDAHELSEELQARAHGRLGGQRATQRDVVRQRYLGHGIWTDQPVPASAGAHRPHAQPPRSATSTRQPTPAKAQRGWRSWLRGPAAGGQHRRRLAPVSKPVLAAALALVAFALVTTYMSHDAIAVRYVHGATAWSGAGAALQVRGTHAELLLAGIPDANSGEHYEVWLLQKDRKTLVPVATNVTLGSGGEAGIELPGDIRRRTAVLVYEESDGQHSAPTVSDHPVATVYVDGSRAD